MIRALLLLAAVAAAWGAAVAATGGFDVRIGPLPFRSRNPVPAFVVAGVCLIAAFSRGVGGVRQALAWWWHSLEHRAPMFAALIALGAVAAGAVWGTYVAGGPDSYCYVNQAEIFARGAVREIQPIAAEAPWPRGEAAFVPIGHVPSPAAPGAIVPMCAAGYPLIMAAARVVAGRTAMFWIVPLMGGLAVWLTFVLGRRVAGPLAGLMAAALFATSPTFLYQIVQPMTDVPAVALWTLALVAALPRRGGERTMPWLAGVAAGAALMVRPNLLPLAAVAGGIVCFARPLAAVGRNSSSAESVGRIFSFALTALQFAAGLLPFVAAIAAIQNAMYGGPLTSGYGDLDALFTLSHVIPNLQRYPAWFVRTETPFVLLALAAPLALAGREARRLAWWLLAFAAAVFACYIPYAIFDAWWYLRFLLPAYPPILVLSSAVFVVALARFRTGTRAAATAVVATALAALHLSAAVDGAAFRMRDLERRFRDGGDYVARHLPADAAVVTFWQSGSVRFYSGRLTMVWYELDPADLDRAMDFLRSKGYRPYLLFEGSEDQEFRRKFEGRSAIAPLDWPPIAEIDRQVRIYDPRDRERYLRGERIDTHRVRGAR